MTQRKRSHDEVEQSEGATADNASKRVSINKTTDGRDDTVKNTEDEQGWQTVKSRSAKRRKKVPRKENDKYPSISHAPHVRLQSVVKLSDLQNLVLYILADGIGPQWCSIQHHANIRKVVVLMVPGLEMGMFDGSITLPSKTDHADPVEDSISAVYGAAENGQHDGLESTTQPGDEAPSVKRKPYASPDDFYPTRLKQDQLPVSLQPLADMFEHVWPVKTPGDDKFAKMHSPLASILSVPIQKIKEDKYSKGPSTPAETSKWQNKRTRVTEFVTSIDELTMNGYVLHPAHFADDDAAAKSYQEIRERNKTSNEHGWLDTPGITNVADGDVAEDKIEQGAITAGRTILAIDCEMCITSPADVQPPVYSLTRMSVVDWDGNVVLDELVKPANLITNYLTPYSGITSQMLKDVTTTLQDAQQKLLAKITPNTILLGHSLDSDLNALQLAHPFVIDTALLYPHPRGAPLKSSLKWLAQKYLSRSIQAGHGSTGHNSIEDARASLDLVKQKCEKGKLWGTGEASNESIFHRLSRSIRPKRLKVHADGENEPRVGAVVDWGDPTRGFGGQAKIATGCRDDTAVVQGIKNAVSGEGLNGDMLPGGVDFVWARFRELEAYRQWWNSSKTLDVDTLRETTAAANADSMLGDLVAQTVSRIHEIWQSLPPCTAFVVYSGSGDPRKLSKMQSMKQQHKAEFAVKKWDELSIRWTDTEEQGLRRACETARRGIGFVTVK